MNTAIILAGGIGTRLGGEKPKQYLDVAGKPVICYCLDKFQNSSIIDEIIIVDIVFITINSL
jgi:D-ribitol-5-phosphate cytidylyltransferase